tara:strand:+ start:206 stop:502 length:297 start_codon:yes stop_codon:yes gene_type:complete
MRNNLTKQDIIKSIYMQIGLPKNVIEEILNDIFDLIIEEVISKKKVKISKFGTFSLKRKNKRIGRNPKTKIETVISERNVVTFKPSKEIKDIINQNER